MLVARESGGARDGSPRLLREINDRAAIEAMLGRGALTRAELEAAIGLSKPATVSLLARLEKAGMVRRGELRGGNRGPAAQMWSVNGDLAHVAGVSLVPGEVDVVIADITGEVRVEHRGALPSGGDAPEGFAAVMVEAAGRAGLRTDQLAKVVVGAQGGVDPATGHLGFAPHLPGWEGFDVPGRLREVLGTDVVVDNDVNLVALVEMTTGRARDVRDFVLVWLGDGLGAAVVIDRVLHRGATGGAGEIDWIRVPDRARRDTGVDRSGARLGQLLSYRSINKLARAHGIRARNAVAAVRAARTGGAAGQAFLADLARRVATGVAGVVSVLDPELVLLTAEIAQVGGPELTDLVTAELHRLVVPRTPVEPAQCTDDAVRAGALQVALGLAREQVFGLPVTAVGVRSVPHDEQVEEGP
ncbi:ROK family protein [Saccharopolyspora hirsuta]|uniref:ROK family protein n=1 Tax=Saccharopolyspora hirsuta TaxID=1837 RepID=A0A5M7BHH4_SACHI|nr:ROK family protein [Saccharopolyspora hirsuta]